jgi:hypothetical protein
MNMSLSEHFFKVLSLYLEPRILIRIRIKVQGKIRIRIHIKVTSRIRIRIKAMRIRNTDSDKIQQIGSLYLDPEPLLKCMPIWYRTLYAYYLYKKIYC